jgi:hypothetical protein
MEKRGTGAYYFNRNFLLCPVLRVFFKLWNQEGCVGSKYTSRSDRENFMRELVLSDEEGYRETY